MEESALLSRKNGDGQPMLMADTWMQEDAEQARENAHTLVPSGRDIQHWRKEREMWHRYYKKLYASKYERAAQKEASINRAVKDRLDAHGVASSHKGTPTKHQEVQPVSTPDDFLALEDEGEELPPEDDADQFKQKLGILLG